MDLCSWCVSLCVRCLVYLIPSVVRMSGFIGGGADKLPLYPVYPARCVIEGIEESNTRSTF